MFTTQGVDGNSLDKRMERNFLGYGIHLCAVTGYDIHTAGTGNKQVRLNFEGKPVDDPNFKASDEAQWGGKTGRASFGPYLKTQENQDEFMAKVALIASRLGVKTQVDAINAATIEEYMEAFVPLIKGKFGYWKLCAREYDKGLDDDGNQQVGIVNEIARYTFFKPESAVSGVETDADGNITKVSVKGKDDGAPMSFSKDNEYDYRPLEESGDSVSDEPAMAAQGDPLWTE